jgi:hypothetical protein
MGCCQTQLEISEIDLNQLNKKQIVPAQTEEFNDLSLSSPSDEVQETCAAHLHESVVYYTRSTSFSLHRGDFEHAFLQTSLTHRQTELVHTNEEFNLE